MKRNDLGRFGHIKIEKAFGQVLKDLRRESGISQEELGFKSGYHRTYISLLERGKKSPSLQTMFRLASALNTDTSEILKRVESMVSGSSDA